MEFSKIYLNYKHFLKNQKISLKNKYEKKKNKDKHANKNQRSFYFEDYIHSNRDLKKIKRISIIEDRVYILFFSFLALISIFSL